MDFSPFKVSKAALALKSGLNLFLLPCAYTSRMRQSSHLKKPSNIRGPLQANSTTPGTGPASGSKVGGGQATGGAPKRFQRKSGSSGPA